MTISYIERTIRIQLTDETDEKISQALAVRLHARCDQTATADEAMMGRQQACNMPYDAILLDMTRPGNNGVTLADLFNTSSKTQDVPMTFLTASEQTALKQKGMALRGAAFFDKSDDFEYVVAT